MSRKKLGLQVFFYLFCFLVIPAGRGESQGWRIMHGQVLQVLAEQGKILLESGGQKLILFLEEDCQILRQGRPTALETLRPVTSSDFWDVLCWINPRGLVSCLWANYTVWEEQGQLVSFDIFGKPK